LIDKKKVIYDGINFCAWSKLKI